MAKVHFLSLGCPKNRVDAEHMLGLAIEDGHQMVNDPTDADTIVVNTCSFIGDAKKESIDAILQMGELKETGGQKLVVSGCLAQRYADQLTEEMPEVDHFIGTTDYVHIANLLGPNSDTKPSAETANDAGFISFDSLVAKSKNKQSQAMADDQLPKNLVSDELEYVARSHTPRVNSMPQYTAYLKISEGCNNTCAFCIIPKLRGKQRSRPILDLVAEAERLAAQGVKELNLIAQDLTGYGYDLPGKPKLAQLLEALSGVEGIRWVRCMYAYPRTLSSDLMHQLNTGSNILPYLDIPVQHGSDRMLRRMKRGKDQKRLSELLLKCRDEVQNLVLRSTVIVGFPGEEDEDFQKLVDFAQAVQFERLGVFKYSDEEDTSAFDLDGKLPYKVKRSRYDKLMRRQRKISKTVCKQMMGQVHEAIVEGVSEEHDYLVKGRLWSQAPEIDGMTYLSSNRALSAGEIVKVKIVDSHDYDLVGEVLEEDDPQGQFALPFNARHAGESHAS
ncbi:MAG: 30S ribosomal protein S12 methylthiotransferase RimO [Myxococcales bacterium]|nr:30S ribosomal protein S12 methylthiotransferase RimO [Myxococcales bacterium]|tara:strand:- start:1666 stop:3168 length:1503 start_codon:yes stop_codon:yes gene_type:complete